ncbi:MAG: hypothetical protein SPL52_05300 [Fibrobacter sp.]|nr:hypothetical protein [Fibrobacter sp.]
MKSLTPVRTARLIASLIAVFGMFVFAVERVLTKVCLMAKDGVQMGLNRYSNSFTGRFAAENFSDDKKLLDVLRQAKDLLPTADNALLVLFILSIVLFIIAAFGLAFPKQFCHMLVAMKLLKWQDGVVLQDMKLSGTPEGPSVSDKLKELCGKIAVAAKKVQPKYWIFIGCSLAFVLVLVFGVRGCSTPSVFGGSQAVSEDLTGQTLYYIQAQKSYFAKTNKVGGPKSLQMPDSLKSDYFTYRVTGGKFTATLNKNVKDCPAGSRWSVSASTKGIFTVDLVLYRSAPKDTNCVFISPDFKNLGRK